MKIIFKTVMLLLTIGLMTSCEDGEKDPFITSVRAPFVKYFSTNSSLDLANTEVAITGTFETLTPDLVRSHEIFVRFVTAGGVTTERVSLTVINSFPQEFSFSFADLESLLGISIEQVTPGDLIQFTGFTTSVDGNVIGPEQTISGELNTIAQSPGYEITGTVICPFNFEEIQFGTYDVTASTFAGFFCETVFTRQVVAGPGNNQVTVIGGEFLNAGSDDLILTLDLDSGDVIGVNGDGTSFSTNNCQNLSPRNTYLLDSGVVLSCISFFDLTLNFVPFRSNPHAFDLRKQ